MKYFNIKTIYCSSQGVASLLTVVIVGAATVIMAISASLISLGELDMSTVYNNGEDALILTDVCVEETLRRIRLDIAYSATDFLLPIGSKSCIINVTGTGDDRTVVVDGIIDDYQKKVEVDLTLNGNYIIINHWKEIDN